jgi:hypothetical protein
VSTCFPISSEMIDCNTKVRLASHSEVAKQELHSLNAPSNGKPKNPTSVTILPKSRKITPAELSARYRLWNPLRVHFPVPTNFYGSRWERRRPRHVATTFPGMRSIESPFCCTWSQLIWSKCLMEGRSTLRCTFKKSFSVTVQKYVERKDKLTP